MAIAKPEEFLTVVVNCKSISEVVAKCKTKKIFKGILSE